jgi:hypothetical protein
LQKDFIDNYGVGDNDNNNNKIMILIILKLMKYINDYCDYDDDDVAVSGSDNHFKSLSRMSTMSMMAACYYYRGVHDFEWWMCLLELKGFEFNQQIMILKELSPDIMVIGRPIVCKSVGERTSCVSGKRTIPSALYLW